MHLGVRLADPRLQHFVDLDPESCAVVGSGDERPVLDSDYFEFLHHDKPFRALLPSQDVMAARPAPGIARARRKLQR